jgi:hypothetical protein
MALEPADIRKLLSLRAKHPDGGSALILGDCYFHFSQAYLTELCGGSGSCSSTTSPRALLTDVAAALRFDRLETIDLFGSPTIRYDLQRDDVPAELRGQFDWIIDAGTLFCCFNVSRVLQHVLDFLKPTGCVFHVAGLVGYLGRSYYSFSPMLFNDFYAQNGFDLIELGVRIEPRHLDRATSRWWLHRRLLRTAVRRSKRSGPQAHCDWQPIGRNETFVASASERELRFAKTFQADEPDILPNNSMIMCFAKRRRLVPFTDAVPEFYAK